jgi:NO-binding membrane sensor protein with MHYT domain
MTLDLSSKYPIGTKPAISFVPYLIFCSYLVSLIGAFTTVELLHRRVSGAGWRSWYVYTSGCRLLGTDNHDRVQVGGCAVSFGLVAIWCMHFVGNRAIILGDGEEEIQLYYSSTYTAVSAILPVVVIFLGLLVADKFYKSSRSAVTRYSSLVICGLCAGAAVTEMHYLGNNGTTNYKLILSWPHVFGAASIAVGACLISFGLFFHWSGHWVNFIWRRIVVACFLALAVSGMHWTAAAGTWYELQGYHVGPGQQRNITLIIALCLVGSLLPRPSRLLTQFIVSFRLRSMLSSWLPQAAAGKDAQGPCTAGRACCCHLRCGR